MRTNMAIREANLSDLAEIRKVYDAAKLFMRETGNPNQWATDYPSNELLSGDIEHNSLYVIESDSGIHAVFVLLRGPDPTYGYIEGKWTDEGDYYVIHRIASDNTLHGILSSVLDFAHQFTDTIRIDTHADNRVMQHLLLKNDFKYCGTIYLENGEPRMAYQKKLSS